MSKLNKFKLQQECEITYSPIQSVIDDIEDEGQILHNDTDISKMVIHELVGTLKDTSLKVSHSYEIVSSIETENAIIIRASKVEVKNRDWLDAFERNAHPAHMQVEMFRENRKPLLFQIDRGREKHTSLYVSRLDKDNEGVVNLYPANSKDKCLIYLGNIHVAEVVHHQYTYNPKIHE